MAPRGNYDIPTYGLLTTSTFAASFEFVGWTIPSLYVSAVWSLHLLPVGSLARDWHTSREVQRSPNLTDSTEVLQAPEET